MLRCPCLYAVPCCRSKSHLWNRHFACNAWVLAVLARLTQLAVALQSNLDKVHVPYSYGWSIILLTILVKTAIFPITRKQVQCCFPLLWPACLMPLLDLCSRPTTLCLIWSSVINSPDKISHMVPTAACVPAISCAVHPSCLCRLTG